MNSSKLPIIREDLIVPSMKYERDTGLSIISLIDNLLEEFLYAKGYIVIDETIESTPEELYSERRSKFSKENKGRYSQLHYESLNFGVFESDEVEEVIDKLLDFSDDELFDLSRDNWKYSGGKYKRFIRQKLDDPLLTQEEFMKHNKINRRNRKTSVTFEFNKKMLGIFNKNKFSKETIDKAGLFLNKLSDEELIQLINERECSDLTSADFILDKMNHSQKLPYIYKNKTGGYYIYRQGYNFGTHNFEEITKVWHFLNDKNWDAKYSTKEKKLGRNKYSEWLYSEMEKEGVIL